MIFKAESIIAKGVKQLRYFKKIVGERLYLSPINMEDVEKFTEWVNDLEVTINLVLSPYIFSLEKEREALEGLCNEGYTFSIITLDNDELIGNCGLLNVNLINRTAEAGIFIGNKEYWNRGYGTEAMNLLLDYAFNLLNMNSIFLRVHSFNKRAIKCYKKCGFKEIGIRREAYLVGDKKYDQIYMDILASEFKGKIPDLIK
ncbi:MAG: GNAT family N-acetyltransferase [Halanaerobiaceae bacterium]|jgi:RimJ/RimL family protein N-acetyltransferase|nr:GNAT family N-acetyltransferase [Halanaerobiaceae bacterium]